VGCMVQGPRVLGPGMLKEFGVRKRVSGSDKSFRFRKGFSIQQRVQGSDTGLVAVQKGACDVEEKGAWDVEEKGTWDVEDLLVVVVERLPNLVPQRRLDAPAPRAKSNQNPK